MANKLATEIMEPNTIEALEISDHPEKGEWSDFEIVETDQ